MWKNSVNQYDDFINTLSKKLFLLVNMIDEVFWWFF